ncbi:hypothetical protein [Streptomyces sp. NPDC002491]
MTEEEIIRPFDGRGRFEFLTRDLASAAGDLEALRATLAPDDRRRPTWRRSAMLSATD